MLKHADNEVRKALFEISRCVDSGDFHKVMKPGPSQLYQVTQEIPLNLKISLTG